MPRSEPQVQLMAMSEFRDFLDAVPDTQRAELAEILRKNDMTTFDGFIGFTRDVMVAILTGDIPPQVAKAAERWAHLCFTAICVAADKYQVSPQKAQMNIVNVLQQAIQAPKQIQMDMMPEYDTLDARDAVLLGDDG